MNIYYVISSIISGTEKIDQSLDWKDAQGSSLSQELHEMLNDGKIICVKKPLKVKIFKKEAGLIKSLLFTGERVNIVVTDSFGPKATLEKIDLQSVPLPV